MQHLRFQQTIQHAAQVSGRGYWSSKPITLTFHLQKSARGIAKYSPLAWIRTRTVSLAVGSIAGKQQENLQTICRYFTRSIPG
jgi:hypothetical protein